MMALRNLLKSAKPIHNLARCYSAGAKLVDVKVNDQNGVATVTMQRMPVNSLNYDLLSQLVDAIDDLENNKTRGMILTSASNTVFSAGLDIMEMYKPQEEKCKKFWTTLQDTWLKLYGSSFPTAAAINGHSPAGGCLLSMCCEYRVMVNNFTIGLNETQLGIVAPKWFIASMQNTMSKRDAEIALTSGRLFTTEEALKVGLVDEIASDKEDALAKAEKFFARFAKVNPLARQLTKASLRGEDLQDLLDNKETDVDLFWFSVSQPMVQKSLDKYIEALKKKSGK
ncbi:PREDICTED: enoyl-CoA delta isomerase 1, mitochondrial-like [Nicrophorus vespilloides]|uniref:Enoyl-CoA delta isomerase 1, mitochondrial-like n=1 Tax=Nicrophorus vespilloides TaxID=110193 RepID=A0ABM1N0F8_NICVS|nr:PREDICTED: enoyl-CoA delta isomerase 1, mitochondrial-like [Nicrophorus vespilloides]